MQSRIRCFVLEPIDPPRQRHWLRRYVSASSEVKCTLPGGHGYHNAMVLIGEADTAYEGEGHRRCLVADREPPPPATDPRWPKACGCGFTFGADDAFQLFTRQLWRRKDTGEVMTLEDAPAGALWNAWWSTDIAEWTGADGRSLHVKTPGGEWCVDSRARNCTLPDDKVHKCWVRHGDWPEVTVDKNGVTCAAGGGSIAQPGYHGFLRSGWLEEC